MPKKRRLIKYYRGILRLLIILIRTQMAIIPLNMRLNTLMDMAIIFSLEQKDIKNILVHHHPQQEVNGHQVDLLRPFVQWLE